jgi:hypothetical protein
MSNIAIILRQKVKHFIKRYYTHLYSPPTGIFIIMMPINVLICRYPLLVALIVE